MSLMDKTREFVFNLQLSPNRIAVANIKVIKMNIGHQRFVGRALNRGN